MADGVCALFQSDSCQLLTDNRTSERGTQQVTVLIYCASLYSREDVVLYEGLLQIQYDQLGCAGLDCLFFQAVQFRTLSYVCGNCDNLAVVVVFFQPRNDNRSIQTAGICQNDFLNVLFCLCHDANSSISIIYRICTALFDPLQMLLSFIIHLFSAMSSIFA